MNAYEIIGKVFCKRQYNTLEGRDQDEDYYDDGSLYSYTPVNQSRNYFQPIQVVNQYITLHCQSFCVFVYATHTHGDTVDCTNSAIS